MAEMIALSGGKPANAIAGIAGPPLPGLLKPLPVLIAVGMALAGVAHAGQPEPAKKTIAPFGTDMTVQKQDKGVALDEVLNAIGDSKAAAENVKILTKLEKARIVHLGKALDRAGQAKVEAALKEHLDDVKALQFALEGNALTYAALNAQTISTSDIVGAELSGDGPKSITMFARH